MNDMSTACPLHATTSAHHGKCLRFVAVYSVKQGALALSRIQKLQLMFGCLALAGCSYLVLDGFDCW